jgi:diacylglycerol kinase family enzyme
MEVVGPQVERLPQQGELQVGVVYNPAAAGARHLPDQIRTLVQSGYVAQGAFYETVPGGIEANAPGLRRMLAIGAGQNPDGTTKRLHGLVIIGGDGTVAMVEGLMSDPDLPDDLQDTVLIPVPNGGASDKSRALFPRGLNLRKLGGLAIKRHTPVRIETTHPDGTVTEHRTTLYDTKGRTAQIADDLNRPWRRSDFWRRPGLKRISQLIAGAWALRKSTHFTVVEQDGTERVLQERIISNNPRMGGFRLFPGDAEADTFSVFDIEGSSWFRLPFALGRLATKKGWQTHKELEYTIGDESSPGARGRYRPIPVSSQHGGENEHNLPPGTRIKATKIGERSIRYAAAK